MKNSISTYKIILLISFLSIAVYGNHLKNSFHFDGIEYIVQNPKIKDLNHISYVLMKEFTQRSLTRTSFVLNYYFGQFKPLGYHLVNLLLHTLNGILVFILVNGAVQTFNDNLSDIYSKKIVPLCTAILFVIHPIQTESVVYIISRSELLSATFYLISFILLQTLLTKKNQSFIKYLCTWGGIFLFFSMALGSKESSATFPAIAFFYYLIKSPSDLPLIVFFKKWRYLIAVVALITLTIFFHKLLTDESFLMGRPTDAGEIIGRKNYLLTQMFVAVIFYPKLLLLPFNLNPDPDISMIKSALDPAFFLPAIILITLSIFIFSRYKNKLLIFAFSWYFITISPSSSIITLLDFAAEHRLYLPSVGFFIIFSYAFYYILSCISLNTVTSKSSYVLVFSILIFIFSMITVVRNYDWRSSLTLWQDTVKKSPRKGRPYMNLGYAFDERGDINEAIKVYEEAKKLSQGTSRMHYNLGSDYLKKGEMDKALNELLIAMKLGPHIPEIYSKLGQIYLKKSIFDKADFYLKKAAEMNPAMDEVFRNLGILNYFHLKNYKQAYFYFSRSLQLNPEQNQAGEIRKVLKNLKDKI